MYFDIGDIVNGKKYFKLVIEKDNDAMACYNLGIKYIDENKLKKAIKLFQKSANNYNDSQIMLNRIGINLSATDEDIDKILTFKNIFKNFGAI